MRLAQQPIFQALIVSALAISSAARAGEPLSSLSARGQLQASDQLPVLPVGAPQLQATTAGAILGYVRNYPVGVYCDGTHDDTVALQAAINSGSSFDLPPGTCVTSASLTVNSSASSGQAIRGAGPPAGNGAGRGKTTIQPAAGVTTAFVIDGSSYGGYIQGFALEDLGLDMSKMAPGSKGFSQLQAYDVRYARVRVFNDSGKISWNFGPGAYTTSLNDVQGSLVYCLGNGVNNPTTITLVNPDINGLDVEQCANVTTIGGAVQPAYSTADTIVFVPPGSSPKGFGRNPDGMYVALGSYLLNAQYFTSIGTDWEALSQPPATCALSGWSFSTHDDGSHGCRKIVMGIQIGGGVSNVDFIDPTFAGMYLYNPGGSGDNLTLTGYQTSGGQANYHEGAETFDSAIRLNNSQALFGYSGDFSQGGTQTVLVDASNGSANFSGGLSVASLTSTGGLIGTGLYINPLSAGSNFATIGQFGCYAASTAAASSCFMGSGSKLVGLQDAAGTTTDFYLDASTGRITSGSGLCPGAGTDANPTLSGTTCMVSGNGNPTSSLGLNGWYYLRGDCAHGSSNCLWHKEAGVWYDLN